MYARYDLLDIGLYKNLEDIIIPENQQGGYTIGSWMLSSITIAILTLIAITQTNLEDLDSMILKISLIFLGGVRDDLRTGSI